MMRFRADKAECMTYSTPQAIPGVMASFCSGLLVTSTLVVSSNRWGSHVEHVSDSWH